MSQKTLAPKLTNPEVCQTSDEFRYLYATPWSLGALTDGTGIEKDSQNGNLAWGAVKETTDRNAGGKSRGHTAQ